MKNTETKKIKKQTIPKPKTTQPKKIPGGGYISPEMNEIKICFENGFCKSGITDDLTEEDGKFEWIS